MWKEQSESHFLRTKYNYQYLKMCLYYSCIDDEDIAFYFLELNSFEHGVYL